MGNFFRSIFFFQNITEYTRALQPEGLKPHVALWLKKIKMYLNLKLSNEIVKKKESEAPNYSSHNAPITQQAVQLCSLTTD